MKPQGVAHALPSTLPKKSRNGKSRLPWSRSAGCLTSDTFQRWRISILIFLSVLGPGIITANVDNDAGGIYTYSVAGARFGYSLLWSLIPITVALIVVQEMVAWMGVVTGKGLADLIREEYGFRTTFLLMMALLLADLGNLVFIITITYALRLMREQKRSIFSIVPFLA